MVKVEIRLFMQCSRSALKKMIGKANYTDNSGRRPSTKWAKALISKHFPEFVIEGGLVLIHRTRNGYSASRCCTQAELANGFTWKYLDITAVEEPAPAAVPTGAVPF